MRSMNWSLIIVQEQKKKKSQTNVRIDKSALSEQSNSAETSSFHGGYRTSVSN